MKKRFIFNPMSMMMALTMECIFLAQIAIVVFAGFMLLR